MIRHHLLASSQSIHGGNLSVFFAAVLTFFHLHVPPHARSNPLASAGWCHIGSGRLEQLEENGPLTNAKRFV
jgi:hypothetical protein